jgi:hypothetical protein
LVVREFHIGILPYWDNYLPLIYESGAIYHF